MSKLNAKIRFQHFHDGNDGDYAVRGPASYATSATLVDLRTGDSILEEWAFCSPKDVASRKKGRQIAYGRLKKAIANDFPEYEIDETNPARPFLRESAKSSLDVFISEVQ